MGLWTVYYPVNSDYAEYLASVPSGALPDIALEDISCWFTADKAGYGLHYLLTNNSQEDLVPVDGIIFGRHKLHTQLPLEQLGVLTAPEVAEIAGYLAMLPFSYVKTRYDPQDMSQAQVYSGHWGEYPEDDLAFLYSAYRRLVAGYAATAAENSGLLIGVA